MEHKVALESWCVKHLYMYCYSRLMSWRKGEQKADTELLLQWTQAMLLCNPDLQIAWNVRKEVIAKNKKIENDMKLSSLILSHKPKCLEVYGHRRWLLLKLKPTDQSPLPRNITDSEFSLCQEAASRYPCNYYAWSHRAWVVQHLVKDITQVVLNELQKTEDWVCCHVSDHSGFHYRQFLIGHLCRHLLLVEGIGHSSVKSSPKLLFSEIKGGGCSSHPLICQLLGTEMKLVSNLIQRYPGHETLWYHRRCILSLVAQHQNINLLQPFLKRELHSKSNKCSKKSRIELANELCDRFLCNCESERQFVLDCLQQESNNNWQKYLIKKHTQWLTEILGWFFPVSMQ
ncbi:protein prenyltransferase alpha subunit repeat-containing protein tempura isoform X2 [Tachypleus tridentatus]